MHSYLAITRPNVWLLTILGIIIGALVAGTLSATTGIYPQFIYALVAALLLCAAGNVVNDFFDADIDKINAPHRPIPSGKISKKAAINFYALLSAIGLVLAFLTSVPYFAIAIFNFVIFTLYPWLFKKIPFIKNLAVAYLAATSFLAAGLITGLAINTALLVLFVVSFIVVISREIFKDIEDVKGDSAQGIKTLPQIISEKSARYFALILLYIGCILLIVPLYLQLFRIAYAIGAVLAIIICIYAAKLPAPRAQRMIKAAMYLVFLGFFLGAVVPL